jgi:hypothetical protein
LWWSDCHRCARHSKLRGLARLAPLSGAVFCVKNVFTFCAEDREHSLCVCVCVCTCVCARVCVVLVMITQEYPFRNIEHNSNTGVFQIDRCLLLLCPLAFFKKNLAATLLGDFPLLTLDCVYLQRDGACSHIRLMPSYFNCNHPHRWMDHGWPRARSVDTGLSTDRWRGSVWRSNPNCSSRRRITYLKATEGLSLPYHVDLCQHNSVAGVATQRVLSFLYSPGLFCSCCKVVRFCCDLEAFSLVAAAIVRDCCTSAQFLPPSFLTVSVLSTAYTYKLMRGKTDTTFLVCEI